MCTIDGRHSDKREGEDPTKQLLESIGKLHDLRSRERDQSLQVQTKGEVFALSNCNHCHGIFIAVYNLQWSTMQIKHVHML